MAQPKEFIQKTWSSLGRPMRLLVTAITILVLWVLFFDSHSIVERISWSSEASSLTEENEQLRAEIKQIREDLSHAEDPAVVERVARETYGMRKEGETVYRVEEVAE